MSKKHPGNSIGRNVPEGWHTTAEAAKAVGRSADTLRRWRDADIFVPSGIMHYKALGVHLYSDEDIEKMKEIVRQMDAK